MLPLDTGPSSLSHTRRGGNNHEDREGLLSHTSSDHNTYSYSNTNNTKTQLPNFIKRLFDIKQMDFEVALDDMATLCSSNPDRVYKTAYYRKLSKNHWYRDDPAFIVIQFYFLLITSFSYSLAFSHDFSSFAHSFTHFLWVLFMNIGVFWLGTGLVISTLSWFLANRYLIRRHPHSVKQELEMAFCWDIHFNSYFVSFLLVQICQFFFLPLIITSNSFIATLLSNTFWAIGFIIYFYISHLGYRSLSFIDKSEYFLYPTIIVIFFYILWIFLSIIGIHFNFGRFFLTILYG